MDSREKIAKVVNFLTARNTKFGSVDVALVRKWNGAGVFEDANGDEIVLTEGQLERALILASKAGAEFHSTLSTDALRPGDVVRSKATRPHYRIVSILSKDTAILQVIRADGKPAQDRLPRAHRLVNFERVDCPVDARKAAG